MPKKQDGKVQMLFLKAAYISKWLFYNIMILLGYN